MAFKTSVANAAPPVSTHPSGIPADKMADAFINVSIRSEDGTYQRLGGIPIRRSESSAMAELLDWLESDPTRAQSLTDGGVEFRFAKPGSGKKFKLVG